MTSGTFLVIGLVGLVLLGISALLGGDDLDTDVDTDFDTDIDADLESDGLAAGVLEWLSIKALALAAVGFGFFGWALSVMGAAGVLVWTVSILVAMAMWILAVRFVFPWMRSQEGDDLQPVEAYQGLRAQVVVRIPPDGIGTVQLTDPNGAVVRRNARATHKDAEIPAGKEVLIVLSTPEHVVVEEFSFDT